MNYVEFVALAGLSHFKADKIIENIIIESKYQVDTHCIILLISLPLCK